MDGGYAYAVLNFSIIDTKICDGTALLFQASIKNAVLVGHSERAVFCKERGTKSRNQV